jgi:hypothetical protein
LKIKNIGISYMGITLMMALLCTSANAGIIMNHFATISGAVTFLGQDGNIWSSASIGPATTNSVTVPAGGYECVYYSTCVGADAYANGTFLAWAEGIGEFSAQSKVTNTFTLLNDSSESVAYTLHLVLTGGSAFTILPDFGTGEAGFQIAISMNGAEIYDRSVAFRSDGTTSNDFGSAFSFNALGSRGGIEPNYYSWSDTWLDIDLGTLAPNQAVNISYDFIAYAFGHTDCYMDACRNGILVGDPFSVGGTGPGYTLEVREPTGGGSSVPEPASLLLGATGLFGLAAMRRRTRSQALGWNQGRR